MNIELFPHQVAAFERDLEILEVNPFYIDTSQMGSGKSFVAAKLAHTLELDLVIVCPLTAKSTWEQISREYDIPIKFMINYESLRGMKGKALSHNLLTREDKLHVNEETDKTTMTSFFHPTRDWVKMIRNGVFLILDEMQAFKNQNDTSKAVRALIKPLSDLWYEDLSARSRFALLSGTPFDKVEHAITFCKTVNIIQKTKMFTQDFDTKRLKPYGLLELIEECKRLDLENATAVLERIMPGGYFNKKTVTAIVYELVSKVLFPVISTSMKAFEARVDGELLERDIKNGHYRMNEEQTNALQDAIQDLEAAAKGYLDGHWLAIDGLSRITKALMNIEIAKIPMLIQLAEDDLEDPNKKVVILCSYSVTIDVLRVALREFSPLVLRGDTKPKDRGKIIESFQSADPDSPRLLIGNLQIGGVSISLHDTDGTRPRSLYIVPNYHFIALHQATGRVFRQGIKSKAKVRFVYGVGTLGLETKILDNLASKTSVMKGLLNDSNVILPGDYPNVDE
jgi:hypothetical protein